MTRASRTIVVYADGPGSPATAPESLCADPALVVGWVPDPREYLNRVHGGWALMAGYATAVPIARGGLRYLPTRLSAARHTLASLRPQVAVVAGIRRGGDLAFGRSVGWAIDAMAVASTVVVEIDETAEDLGAPLITGSVQRIVQCHRPLSIPAPVNAGPADQAIAGHVLSLLGERATLQFGPGSVANAIVQAIDRPVGVWSGLLTDAVAALDARGLLTRPATGAYIYGGDAIVELCRRGGGQLAPVSQTHNPQVIATLPGFTAINTALQVGLDGSVNIERVNGRLVTGIGGHADFCAAAARAPDGLSVIAVRSTYRASSTIVPVVETVSTPRCDVDVVVTEHGIADLRGADDAERAQKLIAIANPTFRGDLARISKSLSGTGPDEH